ncbi:MAG: TVP38/TMEM64 family protein [Rhodocyclaceae bacterium]|nr:TVP38/TMEM64 family protein [Rhodocyclaceae bacterium]MBX3668676.1 TVP38/TMEM64 family protein [Rhodocyclaceae bacterium]
MTHKRAAVLGYLCLMLTGIAVSRAYGLNAVTALSDLRCGLEQGSALHAWVAGGYALALLGAVFLSIPANPLFYLLGGYLFGAVEAALIAAFANALGATAAYRFFGLVVPESVRIRETDLAHGFGTLLMLRMSPWFPAPLITLLCSIGGVPMRRFFLTSLIGTAPLILVYTVLASRLSGPLDASIFESRELLIATLLFGGLSLLALREPVRIAYRVLKDLAARCAGRDGSGAVRPRVPRRADAVPAARSDCADTPQVSVSLE